MQTGQKNHGTTRKNCQKQGVYLQKTWRSPLEGQHHQKKQVQQTTEIPQKANNHKANYG